MTDISNSDDTIDSREVEERIEELESEQDGYIEDLESAIEALDDARYDWENSDPIDQHNGVDPSGELADAIESAATALIGFWNMEGEASEGESTVDHAKRLLEAFRAPADQFLGDEELHALKAFRAEFDSYTEWKHGTQLIRDSYFKEYAQEFAEEIGAIGRNMAWPANCIDWNRAACELQMDYTSGDFDGVTYWAR